MVNDKFEINRYTYIRISYNIKFLRMNQLIFDYKNCLYVQKFTCAECKFTLSFLDIEKYML